MIYKNKLLFPFDEVNIGVKKKRYINCQQKF